MAAAPRKIVSLAHIKAKDEPEPPKPRRIAHHGGAVTTNKPVALLQFLHKKKLRGETLSEQDNKIVAKLKLEISEELKNENSLWTPGSRQSVERLWAAFESDPEKLPVDQLPGSSAGEFVKGGSKKRKQAVPEPPLSKEEALARFKARKEAAQAEKRQKLVADQSQSLFEERRFVLVWAKTAGATSASKDSVTSSVISSVVAAYAGRPTTETEEAACGTVLAEMLADSATAVDGAVQPYRALKYLKEHSGNALYTALARVPASR